MKNKTGDNKEYNYLIRKFSKTGKKPEIFAEFKISLNGELSYEMIIEDDEIQNILELLKKQKGIEYMVPFKCSIGGLNMRGQKKGFVKTTEFTHIMDAIEYNLKSILVEKA